MEPIRPTEYVQLHFLNLRSDIAQRDSPSQWWRFYVVPQLLECDHELTQHLAELIGAYDADALVYSLGKLPGVGWSGAALGKGHMN